MIIKFTSAQNYQITNIDGGKAEKQIAMSRSMTRQSHHYCKVQTSTNAKLKKRFTSLSCARKKNMFLGLGIYLFFAINNPHDIKNFMVSKQIENCKSESNC